MSTRASRASRGWVVALIATVVAATSHALADGEAPSAFGFVASLILAGTACTLLSARRQSLWRLAASITISQILFHSLFSGMGSPAVVAHEHGATLTEASPLHGHSSDMWIAHIVAGVITLVVLRHAESAAWGLARSVRLASGWMLVPWHPAPVPVVRTVAARVRVIRPRARHLVVSSITHRGPPLELVAA